MPAIYRLRSAGGGSTAITGGGTTIGGSREAAGASMATGGGSTRVGGRGRGAMDASIAEGCGVAG